MSVDGPVDGRSAAVSSFDAFFADEYPAVLKLAIALTGNRQVAEDVTSEIFVDAFRRWAKIGTYDQPAAWVRRAVANRASTFRRRRLQWDRLLRGLPLRSVEDPAPLRNDKLWREVARLPRRQAQVIVLHYLEQLSTNEIADLLNISQPSAKTHLQRARRTLGERLQETE